MNILRATSFRFAPVSLINLALTLAVLFFAASTARAQTSSTAPALSTTADPATVDLVHESLKTGAVSLGFLGGGGAGLGKSDNTQFAYAGGRVGIVLTHEFLPGLLRGNFEWDFDVLPMYAVLPPSDGVWGGSIRPLIWKWNFTHGKRIAPYFAAEGGIVFTRDNVPPGDTSQVNFTPGAAFGANFFLKHRRSFFLEGNVGHLSSASLGNHNPGYNVTFLVTAGFSFFKHTN
ncbi:MAG: acyloxyacyl hydrolase [Candidatus Acidiferrales bacterium]